jgi:hypothetical protein
MDTMLYEFTKGKKEKTPEKPKETETEQAHNAVSLDFPH